MTTPKKPITKTESAIQLGNILKIGGPRGGGSRKSIIRNFKNLLKIGRKKAGGKVSKSAKVVEVQTIPKKSLKNQKPDKSPKSSDWDAHMYNQKHRIGHGKSIGPRATATLERKNPSKITRKGTFGTTAKYYKDKSDVRQAAKIKEVQTKPKESLKNQKPTKRSK